MKNVISNDRLTLVVHLSRNTSEQHGFHHRLYPVCIKIDRVEASKQARQSKGKFHRRRVRYFFVFYRTNEYFLALGMVKTLNQGMYVVAQYFR